MNCFDLKNLSFKIPVKVYNKNLLIYDGLVQRLTGQFQFTSIESISLKDNCLILQMGGYEKGGALFGKVKFSSIVKILQTPINLMVKEDFGKILFCGELNKRMRSKGDNSDIVSIDIVNGFLRVQISSVKNENKIIH